MKIIQLNLFCIPSMLPLGGHQLKKQTKFVNSAVIECNFEVLLIKLIKRSQISTHVLILIDN